MQCKLQQSKFATFSSILHKHVDEKIKFLSFCLDREGGQANHLWHGSGPVLARPPVLPLALSVCCDSSMTVIGVIKTTQQPFSSVALPPSPSLRLAPSLSFSLPPRNRYPNGTGSCVRRRTVARNLLCKKRGEGAKRGTK